MDTVVVWIL